MKRQVLQLSIVPSFEDGFVLTLLEKRGRESLSYLLSHKELKRPTSATLESVGQEFSLSEEISVTNEEAENILQLLTRASMSVSPEYALGVDGVVYELVVSGGLNEGHYAWWGKVPKGWQALTQISNALLRLAGKPEIPQ